MLTTPITEQAKQQEWNTICTIARIMFFHYKIVYNLKNKLKLKTQTKKIHSHTHKERNGAQLHITVHSHKVTSLSKSTDLNIAFQTCNNIHIKPIMRWDTTQQNHSSGIYKLQCKTCNNNTLVKLEVQ